MDLIDSRVAESDLPESALNLVRLIGLSKALKLAKALGGTTFPVAKGVTRQGAMRYELLAEVVGVDAADVLTREYGGEALYVPRCHQALIAARNRRIHEAFEQRVRSGCSANIAVMDLARQYQISDRQVWKILKQLPAPVPTQAQLL